MKPDIETLQPGMWVSYQLRDEAHYFAEVIDVDQSAKLISIDECSVFASRVNGQFKCKSEAEAHAEYANAKASDFEKGVFARLKAEENQAHRDLAELIEKAAEAN